MNNELRKLLKQANQGDADAMMEIAHIYAVGIGVESDDAKVIEWLQAAIAEGKTEAYIHLGNFYRCLNTPETDQKAWEAYYAAYQEGDDQSGDAAVHLGEMLYDDCVSGYDDDVRRLEEAEAYFLEAYEAGKDIEEVGVHLWKINLELGYPDDAQRYYDNAKDVVDNINGTLSPEILTWGYFYWACSLADVEEYDQALPYIEKYMQLASDLQKKPFVFSKYATILYHTGHKQEARRQLDHCLELYRRQDHRRLVSETMKRIEELFGKQD